MERTVLHSDLNNFYASVECLYRPELRNFPVAVVGDIEKRHGIVLAKNMLAKGMGVRTGEALWEAREKCPNIIFVPPHYDRYLQFSRLAKEIYGEYTSQVESFGLDECWLDVTDSLHLFGDGKTIAEKIRKKMRIQLGITASVGVSFNKIFAKLGSDMKKPDATTVITKENFKEIVWPLPAKDLLYVGSATYRKLHKFRIDTIGALANTKPEFLRSVLGKHGVMLWQFANGLDNSPVADYGAQTVIKSVGNGTTTPKDLTNDTDASITLYALCESIASRLRDYGLNCHTVQIGLRDNTLLYYERQGPLLFPSHTAQDIWQKAFSLYQARPDKNTPLRSVSVRACQLTNDTICQLSYLPEYRKMEKQEAAEQAIEKIRRRFGHNSVQRGIMYINPDLVINPKEDHIIYPIGFLHNS